MLTRHGAIDRERERERERVVALAKETGNVLAALSTSSIAPVSFGQLGKRLAKPLGEWDSRAIMQQSDADNSRLGASGRFSVSFSPDPPDRGYRVPAGETRSESNNESTAEGYYASALPINGCPIRFLASASRMREFSAAYRRHSRPALGIHRREQRTTYGLTYR